MVCAHNLSFTTWGNIVSVHKRVEVEMEDVSRPPHKFTDLCREVMSLKVASMDGAPGFAFDAIVPIHSGINSRGATVTYRSDSLLLSSLAQKIKKCVAGWFFGYWVQVCKYKVGMVGN